MYIVVIAWLYVAIMMAVAEATGTNGTLLGAVFTFLLYGALPTAILAYILGTPARRRAIKAREAQERAAYEEQAAQNRTAPESVPPNTGSETAAATEQSAAPPVRKEP